MDRPAVASDKIVWLDELNCSIQPTSPELCCTSEGSETALLSNPPMAESMNSL